MEFLTSLFAIVETRDDIREYLGISYIKSYLNSKGFECEAKVIHKKQIEEVLDAYKEFPKVIGISLYCDNQHLVKLFCKKIKETSKECHIIVGGPQVLEFERDILERIPEVDSVCTGEGEETICEVVRRLKNNQSLLGCLGITYREGQNIVQNEPRNNIYDLNELPLPYRELNPQNKKKYFYIVGSRGCLGRCSFCAEYKTGGKGVRIRDAKSIVDEIERLYFTYGVNKFHFTDPTFEDPGKEGIQRAYAIFNEVINRNLNVRFIMYTRVNIVNKLDDEYYDLAYKAGVESYFIGVEAGNEKDLKLYSKGINLKAIQNAIEKLKRHNIYVNYGFICFNPYSTYETLQANLDFLQKSGLCYNSQHVLSRFEIMPQSRMKEKLIEDKLLDEFHFDSNIFSYRWQHEEIGQLYEALVEAIDNTHLIDHDCQIAIDRIYYEKNYPDFYEERLRPIFDEIDILWNKRNTYMYHFFSKAIQLHRLHGDDETFRTYIKSNIIHQYDSNIKKKFYKYTKLCLDMSK